MDINFKFYIIFIPVILFSLTIHEYAHAYIAHKLGDNTAKDQGRLTLNPLVHLDPIGTLLLLIAHFGWAKPVPVDPRNFKNPKKDLLYVAIAGPISNILTAVVSVILLKYVIVNYVSVESSYLFVEPLIVALVWLIFIGVVLAVFNMLPIPPLDGSRVIYGILPDKLAEQYRKIEVYGIFLLFGIFIFGGNILGYIINYPVAVFIDLCNFNNTELNIIFSVLRSG
ncbi:MAG: site-2 protease family protein [Candidatus Dadabacteria bacterium]|nr:site-2 protease family protein [Candidatus Dadabacteria bacterium]NIQ16832.1 site-2 protease family protein [Candidatus Dadabacteria bacterium]